MRGGENLSLTRKALPNHGNTTAEPSGGKVHRKTLVGFTPTGAGGNVAAEDDNCSVTEAPVEDAATEDEVSEDAPVEVPAEDDGCDPAEDEVTEDEESPVEAPAEDG